MNEQQQRPGADPGQDAPDNQGEGNREAARHYNEATRGFVQSGRVDEAAQQAQPQSADEAQQLRRAEQDARARAKEEDPNVHRDRGPTDVDR